jgi:hypothetical protein
MRLTSEQAEAARYGLDAVQTRPFDPAEYYGAQGVPATGTSRVMRFDDEMAAAWPEHAQTDPLPALTGRYPGVVLMDEDPAVGGNSVGGRLVASFELAATVKCSTRLVRGGCPVGQSRIYETCNYYDAKGNWIRKTEGFLTGCLDNADATAIQLKLSGGAK